MSVVSFPFYFVFAPSDKGTAFAAEGSRQAFSQLNTVSQTKSKVSGRGFARAQPDYSGLI